MAAREMKVMVQVAGEDSTGPINVSDKDTVTILVETGSHAGHVTTDVWRLEVEIGEWNGIPRVVSVRTADLVPPHPWGDNVEDEDPVVFEGVFRLTHAEADENDLLRFAGIAEQVYLPSAMPMPVVGLEYRVEIIRDGDGDLVLKRCGEGA